MSKNNLLFFVLIILLSIIPISISEEQKENNTQVEEGEAENNTDFNETNIETAPEEDPFKEYNFTNVIHLDDSNYTVEMKKYDKFFVVFYAPWCGHCHEFIPIYIETADYFKEYEPSVKFIKIDGSKSDNASYEFLINGFPSIFFVYKGERHRFIGPRTREGLIYFMNRKINGDIYQIEKLEELKNIKNIYNSSIILLSTLKDNNTTIYRSFKKFSNEVIYAEFASCLSEECLKKYGEDIILFKNFDEKENKYSECFGKLELAQNNSVQNFTSIYGVEVGEYATQHTINLAFEFERQTIYYIRNNSNAEDVKYDYLFKELGKELRYENIYSFVCSPDGNEIQSTIYKAFSVTPEELPGIFYYDPYSNDKFNQIHLYSRRHVDMKQVNLQYLKDFIKDIKAGKIRRDLYSELPSDKKYINGIKYVIGKTFDEDITDEKDNVLLGLIEGTEDENEMKYIEVLGNLSLKYKDDKEKRLKFRIFNINLNEPRDINPNTYDFPRTYLYAKTLNITQPIRLYQHNRSVYELEEFEQFIIDNLNETKYLLEKEAEAKAEAEAQAEAEAPVESEADTKEKKSQTEDL